MRYNGTKHEGGDTMQNSLYSDLCDVYDEGKKPYLFISYAHEDTHKVVAAIRGLQQLGYRIWYDMGISAGAQWPEVVADHIFGCDAVLAFMTPNSIQSDNCREELFYAKKCNKKILLAYLEKCDLSHGMDMRLGMLQAIERWRCKDDEEFYTRLAKAKNLQPCRGEAPSSNSDTASGSALPHKAEAKTSKSKIEQLREKAEQGDSQAQADLAYAYYSGNGIGQDFAMATHWFHQAAIQGHRIAQYNYGVMCEHGHGISPNMEEAFKWYRKAADQDYPNAIRALGRCYEHGKGVEQNPAEAFRLYQKAADLGNLASINLVGYCCEMGIGTERDMEKAISYYTKAAEQDDPYAQQNLALCYEYSKGVAQDWNEAAGWYRRAAELGNSFAQQKMAKCCREGLGVPIDEAEAARWQKLYDENPNK